MEKKELTAADVWVMFAETDRKMAETDRIMRENERILNEKSEKLGITVKDINSNVAGISNSNGEYAEEYFYNSLKKKMEFAGVHFDDISTTFKRLRKAQDGRRVEYETKWMRAY